MAVKALGDKFGVGSAGNEGARSPNSTSRRSLAPQTGPAQRVRRFVGGVGRTGFFPCRDRRSKEDVDNDVARRRFARHVRDFFSYFNGEEDTAKIGI